MSLSYELLASDGAARRGRIATAHGTVETPAFMPVGTAATVKAMKPADVRASGADIILGNTYHLMLRPGAERIARLGALHDFMGWDRPILTDSGGYQVFSLAARRTIEEEGARFRSHLDGSLHKLTPEKATDIQAQLGSDIAMVLDECLAHPATEAAARASMERTLRWACRARDRFLALRDRQVPGVVVTRVNLSPRFMRELIDAMEDNYSKWSTREGIRELPEFGPGTQIGGRDTPRAAGTDAPETPGSPDEPRPGDTPDI